MLTTPGGTAELYGWEHLRTRTDRLVVCEGEFDRLVLEGRGIAAVTSTAGASTFRMEWADALRGVSQLFVCFDRDAAGEQGAARVSRLLPDARVVRLPDDVGDGGDVTDFFIRLGRSTEDFDMLLASAQPARVGSTDRGAPPVAQGRVIRRDHVLELKRRFPIETVATRYVHLRRVGRTLVGRCPFHDDRHPSFVVYPSTQLFHCFGCEAHGDVLTFVMLYERIGFPEAVDLLRRRAA